MSNPPTQDGASSSTRRDRREAARRDRRLAAASTTATKPAWQSPMLLISVAAVAVGLVVILVASGVLGGRGTTTTGDLLVPIRPTPVELTNADNGRALGTSGAPVTIEVWSDFQCPACDLFARQVEPDLIDQYVKNGTVLLVYRDMAFIDGGDPNGESHQAAAAARCAAEQGKFWPYHDYLFENQKGENTGGFSADVLDAIGTAVGLDATAFNACMDGTTQEEAVAAETAQGSQAGVTSTPTVAINGVLQRAGAIGMADSSGAPGLKTLIEAELAKSSPAPAPSATPTP
jgi:protein-disulfide isomerase